MNKKIYEFLSNNRDKSLLVVCDNNIKLSILNEYMHNRIQDISFITKEEFLEKLIVSFDNRAIYYLVKEKHLAYDVCKMYLNNIKYLLLNPATNNLKPFEKNKISELNDIYTELKEKNYAIINELYKTYLKRKKIVFIGSDLYKEEIIALNSFDYEVLDISFEERDNLSDRIILYKQKDFEDEIFYVLETICDLLNSGVKPGDIKIVYSSSSNTTKDLTFKRMLSYYGLTCNGFEGENLSDITLANKIIDDYYNDNLSSSVLSSEFGKLIFDKLSKIIAKYPNKNEESKYIARTLMKSIKISMPLYSNSLELINLNDISVLENKHIFIINVNQGVIPSLLKDEDYFSDEMKEKLSFSTSYDKNSIINNNFINNLYSNNHFYLSCSSYENGRELYVSNFVSDNKINIIRYDRDYSFYSHEYNKVLLIKYLDLYHKYNIKHTGLASLCATYDDYKYNEYDNSFTGISFEKINRVLRNKIGISYTSINGYYQCAFSYYLDKILKIGEYEANIAAAIGNITHYVLSKAFLKDFDFDKEFLIAKDNESVKFDFSAKNLLFLENIKPIIKETIEIIKEQNNNLEYKSAFYETEIINDVKRIIDGNEVTVKINGKIDKLLVRENKSLMIVDYKTGSNEIKKNLMRYGLSLQLPFYIHLLRTSKEYKDSFVFGAYLQHILQEDILKEKEKDNKEKIMKLDGFTNCSFSGSDLFDKSYENSKVIKGLSLNSESSFTRLGLSHNLTNKDFIDMEAIVKDKIEEFLIGIAKGNFIINPKKNASSDLSCEFCKYQDICFKRAKDYVFIGDKEDGLDS